MPPGRPAGISGSLLTVSAQGGSGSSCFVVTGTQFACRVMQMAERKVDKPGVAKHVSVRCTWG